MLYHHNKLVEAEPMTLGFFIMKHKNHDKSDTEVENPEQPGYRVTNVDGSVCWVEKSVFEADFEEAKGFKTEVKRHVESASKLQTDMQTLADDTKQFESMSKPLQDAVLIAKASIGDSIEDLSELQKWL